MGYRVALVLGLFLLLVTAYAQDDPNSQSTGQADWIPVGSVSPLLERHALSHREFLQNRSPAVQRAGLRAIRADLERFDRADMRIAFVPLVIDLITMEYRLLNLAASYTVDAPTRSEAIHVLAEIGGSEARAQLRETIRIDDDASVRAGAAVLLAKYPGAHPDDDLAAIGHALESASRRGGPEEEMYRLLSAAAEMHPLAWDPQQAELLRGLSAIATGHYSSSLRRKAFSMLEELARR